MRSLSLLTLIAMIPTAHAAEPTKPKLLVPAYFYPAGDGMKAWETLLNSANTTPIVAIVDPDNGPGKRADANYTSVYDLAVKSKATLIGYVTLGYSKRAIADIKADIDRWIQFYPNTRGIFFDEQPSDAKNVPFALEAFAHVRTKIKNALVISNPGTVCDPGYLGEKGADAACLFEGPGGFGKYKSPDWVAKAGAEKVVLLTYDVRPADLKTPLDIARESKAGYVYVTDAKGTNPWDRLPSYWRELQKR